MNSDGINGAALHALAICAAGVIAIAAAAMRLRQHRKATTTEEEPNKVMPILTAAESGRAEELESFSHYAGRQIGFEDMSKCPNLGRLSMDYLLKVKDCEEDIYAFFGNYPNPESLSLKLIDELDKCILGYFSFHWKHAPLMVSQALAVDADGKPRKKLKHMVMEATRKIRFERITKNLKVTRVFSTLLEEMKAIGCYSPESPRCTEVMVPADRWERSPVLLLMGGGMGAGKSTVLKHMLKEPFWSGTEAVVVEADAFKETDVIYRALSSRGHHNDMLQTAELVHQSSTDAASSLLVTALNEGRDVIMDGTLSWEPYVQQTIAMARDVHRRRYRMGVGYKVADDGTVVENYWEPADDEEEEHLQDQGQRRPYRIEIIGVICNAHLAVVRGMRRAILVRRAVRVKSQLNSHKSFASAFPSYCQMVDHARLYSTNAMGSPPKLIAWKDGSSRLLVDPEEIECLEQVSSVNVEANSICELHPCKNGNAKSKGFTSIWDDVVLSPEREVLQKELKTAIVELEDIDD